MTGAVRERLLTYRPERTFPGRAGRTPAMSPRLLLSVLALLLAPPLARGAMAQDSSSAPRRCYRFAFGAWTPPLDWTHAGHHLDSAGHIPAPQGAAGRSALEDSTGADTSRVELTLFPAWWPAGVIVRLRRTAASGDTLHGTATALVADGRLTSPEAEAVAIPVPCRAGRGGTQAPPTAALPDDAPPPRPYPAATRADATRAASASTAAPMKRLSSAG